MVQEINDSIQVMEVPNNGPGTALRKPLGLRSDGEPVLHQSESRGKCM